MPFYADRRRRTGSASAEYLPHGAHGRDKVALLWEHILLSPWFSGRWLPQRTIVNKRPQRTDHGQRHSSQARSPSWIEKKMICALPTMFWSGT